MLERFIPQCPDKFVIFYKLNIVFREGFNSDESCELIGPDYHLEEAYCNYDEASKKTAEDCEKSNGVLYNVYAQERCAQHNENAPHFYIDTEYENAYLCVGKSCDVDEVLEKYQREIESDGRCSLTFKPTRSQLQKHLNNSNENETSTSSSTSEDVTSSKSMSTSSSEDEASSKATSTSSTTDYHSGVRVFTWVFGSVGISIVIFSIWKGFTSRHTDHTTVDNINTEYMGRRYDIEDDEEDMVAVQIT